MAEHVVKPRQEEDWLRGALGLQQGQAPFPWQLRLLRCLCSGDAVDALDLPTGLGKTATMAVWLVARALGAKVPRRLVYVVDRRAVVDQATAVAERLRAWVAGEGAVAEALGLAGRALPISTLRGQYADNREWLEDPSVPAIVVGTVDMIGSRLLFEGYRCSRKMRPYHAALLGADALILLDEAHLVPAFEAMVRVAVQHEALKPQAPSRELIPPNQVVSLSATGGVTPNPFRLDGADLANEVIKRRLHARKQLQLVTEVAADALATTLAAQAWELTDSGKRAARVIVFVDRRKTAQEVTEALHALASGAGDAPSIPIEIELFVGGRRVAEREAAATRLGELGFLAGSTSLPEKPVFVIATSAGEVGVDLDADHAVLDLVEWERMVQRLGRVNRRGDGAAEVRVVPPAQDEKTSDALKKERKILEQAAAERGEEVSGDAEHDDDDEPGEESEKPVKRLNQEEAWLVAKWRRLEATRTALARLPLSGAAHDASPSALGALKADAGAVPLLAAGSTPPPLHPELTRAVLEAWSMTSLEDHTGRPPVAPWLRGWVDDEAQTTLAWRRWLPRKADADEYFEAAPVELLETLERETTDVLDWLTKRVKQVARALDDAEARDPEGHGNATTLPRRDDVVAFILDEAARGWTLGELEELPKRQRDDLLRSLAGSTLVVDARLGGLDENGLLDPKADSARDVSDGQGSLLSFRVREVESLDGLGLDHDWRVEDTFTLRKNAAAEVVAWLVVETRPAAQATTADGRSTGRAQALDEHQACAARHARAMGARLGLRPEDVELLALAAVLHDEGKRPERWQRAFRVPVDQRPLGKSTSRPLQSVLAGYRHELGSLPYAERDPRVAALTPEDRDLVLHVIAAHHGLARPNLRTDGCDDAPPSALVERARGIALRFARLEQRWGPWGLAWWETLLRAADQQASRENDERGGIHG